MSYVGEFGYALGAVECELAESVGRGLTVSSEEDLAYAGFSTHHIAGESETGYDLAERAVRNMGLDRDSTIDAIIYATCIPENGNSGSRERWFESKDVKHLMQFPAGELQATFGWDDAIVLGVTQQACTSMLGSARIASALLEVEHGWSRILCVSSDRFPSGSKYEQAYNLISDGAAGCVVSREPSFASIVAAHQITNGGMSKADDDETVGMFFAYAARVIRECAHKAGVKTSSLDWIVAQNTNIRAWQVLCSVLDVDFDRIWAPSISEVGHVISSDPVINIRALADSRKAKAGDLIALVMAGFGLNWQCLILRVE